MNQVGTVMQDIHFSKKVRAIHIFLASGFKEFDLVIDSFAFLKGIGYMDFLTNWVNYMDRPVFMEIASDISINPHYVHLYDESIPVRLKNEMLLWHEQHCSVN